MDPVSVQVVSEVWHAAGAVGILILLLSAVIYAGYRDAKAREKSMVKTIASCQEKHDEIMEKTISVAARAASAIENNTRMTEKICDVVDIEFQRRGKTPAEGSPIQHH